MKIATEIDSITIPFSNLAKGETYREELHGTVYMKLQTPIEGEYGHKYNTVNVETGGLEHTFDNADIFPVDGTFVEGYKKG